MTLFLTFAFDESRLSGELPIIFNWVYGTSCMCATPLIAAGCCQDVLIRWHALDVVGVTVMCVDIVAQKQGDPKAVSQGGLVLLHPISQGSRAFISTWR